MFKCDLTRLARLNPGLALGLSRVGPKLNRTLLKSIPNGLRSVEMGWAACDDPREFLTFVRPKVWLLPPKVLLQRETVIPESSPLLTDLERIIDTISFIKVIVKSTYIAIVLLRSAICVGFPENHNISQSILDPSFSSLRVACLRVAIFGLVYCRV
ncbi:hypothetical protein K435DRAFT_813319 [Dendrothele bispora CBS 962.96]|uniref:Uncharacterized protein n=1 Tax=Dendrothele bispora (strain CBS 962.96) TaxID=1314807 RepID=A0A4S8KLU8_DENBC|nr:hypothetical protein K435DRAFT_813319 [Dendrothele bispora CBS 962.96]